MQSSAIPTKFAIPFANGAGPGYIRGIPQASQIGITAGAASLTDGFPPLTFVPIAGGGSWPFGQDFNGILNQMTAWERWLQAGAPIVYDAAFSTAIGGYPKGAVIRSLTTGGSWISQAENNTSNPETGGANWSGGLLAVGVDPFGANLRALGGTYGVMLRNDGTNAYLMQTASGSPLGTYNAFRPFYWNLSTGAVTLDAGGAGVTMGGLLTVNRIRITAGAYGTADNSRAVSLGDFSRTVTNPVNEGWTRLPDGTVEQVFTTSISVGGGARSDIVALSVAYPNQIFEAMICFSGTAPPGASNPGSVSVIPSSPSAVTISSNFATSATLGVTIKSRGY